jgi:hypothetical protein
MAVAAVVVVVVVMAVGWRQHRWPRDPVHREKGGKKERRKEKERKST